MRASKVLFFCQAVALFLPAVANAGQIAGSVILGGRGVDRKRVEIDCNGAKTTGTTAADGSYRLNVPQEGQCTITLPEFPRSSAVVFSSPGPADYHFELIQGANGRYELRRR